MHACIISLRGRLQSEVLKVGEFSLIRVQRFEYQYSLVLNHSGAWPSWKWNAGFFHLWSFSFSP